MSQSLPDTSGDPGRGAPGARWHRSGFTRAAALVMGAALTLTPMLTGCGSDGESDSS